MYYRGILLRSQAAKGKDKRGAEATFLKKKKKTGSEAEKREMQ